MRARVDRRLGAAERGRRAEPRAGAPNPKGDATGRVLHEPHDPLCKDAGPGTNVVQSDRRGSSGPKILLATADSALVELVTQGLEDAVCTTVIGCDGAEGIREVDAATISALILDAGSSSPKGLEICGDLRANGVTTPVLAIVDKGDSKHRILALESGADDCLSRPFVLEELLARLHALIRRDKVVNSARTVVGDLVVDSAASTVSRAGRDITLTHREFTLLEALALNAGKVVARAEIQERIWGDGFSSSNTVDVHIRSLRQKIDQGFEPKLIHTVFREGYMLAVTPPSI